MTFDTHITRSKGRVFAEFLRPGGDVVYTADFRYRLSDDRDVLVVSEVIMYALNLTNPEYLTAAIDALLNHALIGLPYRSVLFRITNMLDVETRVLWQAMGYRLISLSGVSYFMKEFYTPSDLQGNANLTSNERQKIDPLIDPLVRSDEIAPEKAGPPVWSNMEDVAVHYSSNIGHGKWTVDHVYRIFADLMKDIRCRMCRYHYTQWFQAHPLDFYLRVENNSARVSHEKGEHSTDFTLVNWVTQCHNSVNIRLHREVWSPEMVRKKWSADART